MKTISLGTSDFKEFIDNNYYFIDKTLIIKEFLKDSGKIVLLTRSRPFGKTLNMSIIKHKFISYSKDSNEISFATAFFIRLCFKSRLIIGSIKVDK